MTIAKDSRATIQAIKNCIGKTVSDIARVQSYFNDHENNEGFGDLEFTFTDSSHLTLKGFGDSESIYADNKKAEIYKTFKVTDTDISTCKLLDLKEDLAWNKIVGQTLQKAEVEWSKYDHIDDRLSACILRFDNDFVIFYETNSDTTKFYLNKPLPAVNKPTRIESIE